MKKYVVTVSEIHDQDYKVEANNPEAAREAVLNGEGTEVGSGEYVSVANDHGMWPVREFS